MKLSIACLSAAFLALSSANSHAATIYTSQASFLSVVNAGTSFTNTFDVAINPANYSNGTFAYSITSPGGLFFGVNAPGNPSGTFVGVNVATDALTVTFTSGNVTAVGGNFFLNDVVYVPVFSELTVNLSDGTSDAFTPSSINDYRGYTVTGGLFITSLVIPGFTGQGNSNFANIDNFTVGQFVAPSGGVDAVPVPATALMGLLAVPALRLIRRRS
jgi:hypothetical protein